MLRKLPLLALAPVLTLLAQPASALDIDRIEVKSQLGQPLLAEIRVMPGNPAELDRLQAQLALPATFARIGLARPQGVLSDLQFKVTRNAHGNPVIQITSSMPVRQDFLTFLVQVDWGDGRLVREYSISLDAPDTLPIAAMPLIEAPTAAPSNAIVREPSSLAIPLSGDKTSGPVVPASVAAAPIPLAASRAPPPRPQPRAKSAPRPVEPTASSVDKPVAVPSGRVAAKATVARASAPAATQADLGAYGPVKAGETLSKIAGRLVGDEYSLNQAMLALLRVNPDAFVDGNINMVRQGAILRTPPAAELARYSTTEAAVMVRDQIDRWRERRATLPQPAALPQAPASVASTASIARAGAPHIADARLEIAPPSFDITRQVAAQPGLESGVAEGALRQLRQAGAAEESASRNAELLYLKTRVAELDSLQRRQQALITLKDKELAKRSTSRTTPWLWLLAVLAVVPSLTWWFARRRMRMPGLSHPGLANPMETTISGARSDDGTETDQRAGPDDETQAESQSPAWHAGASGVVVTPAEVETHSGH